MYFISLKPQSAIHQNWLWTKLVTQIFENWQKLQKKNDNFEQVVPSVDIKRK